LTNSSATAYDRHARYFLPFAVFFPEHTQTKCKEGEIRFKKDIGFHLHKNYVDLNFPDIVCHFACATGDRVKFPELQKLNIELQEEN